MWRLSCLLNCDGKPLLHVDPALLDELAPARELRSPQLRKLFPGVLATNWVPPALSFIKATLSMTACTRLVIRAGM
ncbi:MAG: hypothetical protein A3G24_17255 [Betaproteobacteria bacterium RIFCSPLOWO2_12_FULL_62_13]|nr:MAG: hypothetical protein A3G24_17255 [Betaproteobacteria bacterium RIFCSPLOWO2_12_FULL_62_13]